MTGPQRLQAGNGWWWGVLVWRCPNGQCVFGLSIPFAFRLGRTIGSRNPPGTAESQARGDRTGRCLAW
jgi:hypothetical protein